METLSINSKKLERRLVAFVREQASRNGFKKVVVGLSGGLDSSIVLYLCVQALGPGNVFGLILPYRHTSSASIKNARLIARKYRVKTETIAITSQIDSYFKNFPRANRIRRGNKMARERMSVLYDQAKALNALVVGTSNKSEILLGYGTIYGDLACAFNPLGNLYKTQLRQLAKDIGIPQQIIQQAPTAGLWPGQSDEEELGLTYTQADQLFYYLVDKKFSLPRLLKMGFEKEMIKQVSRRIAANAFKSRPPVIAKI